jgi:hypothetical protein
MKKICLLLFSVFMLVSVSAALGQSSQDDIAESNQQFEQWSKNLAEFVKDVRFNEEDVKSFLSLADDFNSFGAEEDDDSGEYLDFTTILNDEDYLAWAKSKGINSDNWLKKTMRIIAVMMRTEIEANISGEPFDLQAQMEDLEEMRAQMGEEEYQQMKQALAAGNAAMEGMEDAYKHLPVPTDAEKALLAKYKDQLMNLE